MKIALSLIGVLFLVSLSPSALAASFAGHWVVNGGQMQAKYLGQPAGSPIPCSIIEIQMELTDQTLTIVSYHAKCGSLEPKWGPYPMQLRDGTVYTDNEVAGTFDGQNLNVRLSGGYYLNFALKDSQDPTQSPTLETLYGVTNVLQAIEITGSLSN